MNGKIVIAGILGFTAGGLTGFYIGKRMVEEQHAQQVNEEIESLRQTYDKRRKIINGKLNNKDSYSEEEAVIDPTVGPETFTKEELENSVKIVEDNGYITKENRISQHMIFPIFPITFNDYTNDYDDYDKVELEWFTDDTVLVDNVDDIVNPGDTLGFADVEQMFDQDENDMDTAYIRNTEISIDFMIIRRPGVWPGRE